MTASLKKMLIVDDMRLNHAILGEVFRSSYVLLEAYNGAEALELLEREWEGISIVLLDLVMPVMDGFGLLREMKKRGMIGKIPVVLITAENSEKVMQQGCELGVSDIITRPFNPTIVQQRIGNIIELYSYKRYIKQMMEQGKLTFADTFGAMHGGLGTGTVEPAVASPKDGEGNLLNLEREKYRILSELSGEILFEYTPETDEMVFSDKYHQITGHSTVVCQMSKQLAEGDYIFAGHKGILRRMVEGLSPVNPSGKCEIKIKLSNDCTEYEWFELSVYALWRESSRGSQVTFLGKFLNVNDQKRENDRLRKVALNDPLTQILNRRALFERVKGLLETKTAKYAALCFVDVDNFKSINDTFGHAFGDVVLQNVAQRLKQCIGESDLIGRIGGDEFVIFFHSLSSDREVEEKVNAICQELHAIQDGCSISGSIGVARYPQDGADCKVLLYKADQALYLTKKNGKDGYHLYNEECTSLPFRPTLGCEPEEVNRGQSKKNVG